MSDAWPVWCETYGYLPSFGASPPFHCMVSTSIILLRGWDSNLRPSRNQFFCWLSTASVTCCMSGWKDSGSVDSTRSDCVSQVHIGVGRLELRRGHVGSDIVRRTAVLELAKSGRHCRCQQRIQFATAYGLSLYTSSTVCAALMQVAVRGWHWAL